MKFEKLNIKVMGYREAIDYVYSVNGFNSTKPFAIISIQEMDTELMPIKFKPAGKCKLALNIHFSDVTNDRVYREAIKSGRHKNELKIMNLNDAKRIKSLVDKAEEDNEIEELIIHCHAGISRSAAVAAALCKVHGIDDSTYFTQSRYSPNMYVYDKILQAYGIKTSNKEYKRLFREKKSINKKE